MKVKPFHGWADVGSNGGVFVTILSGCHSRSHVGRLAIYETKALALAAGVKNPVEVLIGNVRRSAASQFINRKGE